MSSQRPCGVCLRISLCKSAPYAVEYEVGELIMEHPHIRGLSEWRPLARGGRAVVWEARQLSLGRLVAVKVYQSELDEGDRRRFLREAAAAGRLSNHPGVVTAHVAGVLPDDRPYLIMELYPGGSLTQWLKAENRPSEERVRQVGVRIADALAAVHASGVLHRDVKPANILIDRFGNPALADFGLAVVAGAEAAAPEALGITPAYAPPEAFAMQPATEAGDVFSLAATLYALIAGSPPRSVGAAPVVLEQMFEVANRPIGQLPWVNWYLMDALMTALSIAPAARPTAAEFRDQLANVPAARPSKRKLHVGAAEDASSVSRGWRPEHSTTSRDHDVAVAAITAESQPVPDQVETLEVPRRRGRRREGALAVAAALVTVIASATAWMINETAASVAPPAIVTSATPGGLTSSSASSPASDPRPTSTTTSGTGSGSGSAETIQVQAPPAAAKPFQTVLIHGTYSGAADTLLRVQLWEGGKWLALPLPAKTNQTGQFTAYVELGQPGRYQLRVLDPDSGVTSNPSELVIMG
jgi:serine/threonine protein kinase